MQTYMKCHQINVHYGQGKESEEKTNSCHQEEIQSLRMNGVLHCVLPLLEKKTKEKRKEKSTEVFLLVDSKCFIGTPEIIREAHSIILCQRGRGSYRYMKLPVFTDHMSISPLSLEAPFAL